MSLLLILPIALPLGLGAWLFARSGMPLAHQHRLSLIGAIGQFSAALGLLALSAQGRITATLIGDWPVPYGIVLAADRLSALMLTLASALGLAVIAHLSLSAGVAERGRRHFHALFQLQLFGLAGAFLTADLFNLFVFFEVLLVASYGLLIQGGGPARSRAALHYVVLNMVGSSLFLMGVASIYAVAGTLNLAELSERLQALPPAKAPLAATGLLLLTGAFALKAALVPLHAWLVPAYSAALAPVAALFAIMTKVGVYALLRLFALVPMGAAAGSGALAELPLAELSLAGLPIQAIIATGALLTITVGSIGVLAAAELRAMTAYLILVSVGTLLAGVAIGTAEGIAAGLYYLIHTTLVTAGLFLLVDVISRGRTPGSWLLPAQPPPAAAWLGGLFLLGALAIAGLPPLSGFVGKALILDALLQSAGQEAPRLGPDWMLSWILVLGSSLLVMVGLSRAGITLFWQGAPASTAGVPGTQAGTQAGAKPGTQVGAQLGAQAGTEAGAQASTQTSFQAGIRAPAAAVLLSASPMLALLAGPIAAYTEAAALQLLDGGDYLTSIQGLKPVDPPAAATGGNSSTSSDTDRNRNSNNDNDNDSDSDSDSDTASHSNGENTGGRQ